MSKKKLKTYKAKVGRRADGTPITKPFYGLTMADAKEKAQAFQDAIGYETHLVSENEYYFRGWAAHWLTTYKRPFVTENAYYSTYENPVVRHLIPALGDRLMADITPKDVQELYNEKTFLSGSMCTKIAMCLNAIFESAIDNDICFKNPARFCRLQSSRLPNIKEVFDDKQIRIAQQWFINTMPEVVLMLEAGVRREEMCGWYKTDFDLRKKLYHVQRAVIYTRGNVLREVPPKDNSFRTNPLSPMAARAYGRLCELAPDSRYLVPGRDGGPLHPSHWSSRLKTEMGRMHRFHPDLPQLTAHELRHTYGTFLRRHGVDIYTIAKILGHKDVKVTSETYVHNELSALRKALRLIYKRQEMTA